MTEFIILNWDQYKTLGRLEFSTFTVSPVLFKWEEYFFSPWRAVQFPDHLTALSPVEMKWIIAESGPYNETRILTCNGPIIIWFTVIVFSITFIFPGALVILINSVLKRRQKIPFSPNDVFMINLTVMDVIYSVVLSADLY